MNSSRQRIIVGALVVGILIVFLLRPYWREPQTGNEDLFQDNQTYHFETLRALGYATTGGADINEVLYTVGTIETGDPESWYHGWSTLADGTVEIAESYRYDQAGRANAYLKASNYYRTAEFLLHPDDPRKLETYRRGVETFYRGLNLSSVPYEQFEVPYGDSHLDGIFFAGDPTLNGNTLIMVINGYDSIKEETYFVLGRGALDRGFSFMSYDGPGQGSAIRERGIHMTHDWGTVNEAVLDVVLNQHPEIEQVVLVGYSLGSVLATKAAATDSRISMLVQFNIMYDFSNTPRQQMPASFANLVFTDEPRPDWVSSLLEVTMQFDSQQDWAIRHGSWVMGIDDPAEVLNAYRHYENSEDAPEVTVPVLLVVGENDHFVSDELIVQTQSAFSQAESITTLMYDAPSGGDEHCQMGAMSRWNADFFEWVYANLESRSPSQ